EQEVSYTTIKPSELLNSVQATGIVVPEKTVTITAEMSETVSEINKEEGTEVSDGSQLLSYDSELAEADLKESESNLSQSQVSLEKAKAQVKESESAVELAEQRMHSAQFSKDKSLQERISQSKIELAEAKQELSRLQRLEKKGAIGQVKVTKQEYKVDIYKSKQKLLEKELKELQETRDNRVAEAKVELKRAQKSYQVAEKNHLLAKETVVGAKVAAKRQQLIRDNYSIQSPLQGTIIEQQVEAGEYVQVGQTLFKIASDKLLVRISPDETELALLELGQKGVAVTEANPDQQFEVEVTKIAPQVDSNRGTIDVYLDVVTSGVQLRPNMSVSVELINKQNQETIFLSEEYIVEENGQNYVYLYRQGQAVKREIELDRSYNGRLKVTKGLSTGDKVIDPTEVSNGEQIKLEG
ncbi:MAG: efflux RND transporter periplasmic adaptor subunit, partial [Bacillota bacterium]